MIKKSSINLLLFLLPFSFFAQSLSLTHSSVNQYRQSATMRILDDVQDLADAGEINRISPYMPDVIRMINNFGQPYPGQEYNIAAGSKKLMEYIPEIVESFKTMDAQFQAETFATFLYFGDLTAYKKDLEEQLSILENEYDYNSVLDNIITIQAASGQYDLAKKQLDFLGKNIDGDRALMHLAVKDASKDRIENAVRVANKSLDRISPRYPKFETLRQFFHLVELLGEKQKKTQAFQLIAKCPKEENQIIAKAFLAKGLGDKSLLKKAAEAASVLEKDRNYPLKEIGILAARMDAIDLAEWCVNQMDTISFNQNPISVLTKMTKVTKDKHYLSLAIDKIDQIPIRAISGYADALIQITLTAVELELDEEETIQLLNLINQLNPEYRIKFHLRLLKIPSQRYYMAYY